MSKSNGDKILSTKQKEQVYLELHKKYPDKYGFFICELHFGGASVDYKLCSTTDIYGPFGILSTARKKYKKYINSDTGLFAIRGPWHTNEHGHSTQFYSHKENE